MQRGRHRHVLRRLIWAAVIATVLIAAVPTLAVNIRGGAGPDVLRGTTGNDRIDGKSGNDRIFGLDGRDVLTGGPGADYAVGGSGVDRLLLRDGTRDRALCGPGRDTVVADRIDRAAADCEVVLVPDPPATPPAPPAPPPPPPPPPPTDTPVTPGSYRGQTQTGNFVFFDILANRSVTGWRVNDVRRECDGPLIIYGPMDLGQTVFPIDARGNFSREFSYDSGIRNDKGEITPAKGYFRLTGTVQGSSVSGTVISTLEFVWDGRPYRCSNGDETWTATRVS